MMRSLFSLFAFTTFVAGQCENPVRRREWHDLSRSQQEQWAGCIRTLYESGEWLGFQDLHSRMRGPGHGNPYFLLFHRAFIYEVEQALRGAGCNFGMPYLDAGAIYNHISDDDFWQVLGDQSGCIQSGPFEGMQTSRGSCISRSVGSIRVVASPLIKSLVETTETFLEFTVDLENGQHALVHQAFGGSMSNLDDAAADPLFMLHHGYVEYLYATWQSQHPDRYEDIGGQNPDDYAAPFGERYTLGQLADYQNQLCYTYGNPRVIVGEDPPSDDDPEDPSDDEPGSDDDEPSDEDPDSTDDDDDEPAEIKVPEDQLTGDIEEPDELDQETIDSFNLDPEKVAETRDKLKGLVNKIEEMIKNGDLDQLWDDFKKGIEDATDEDDDQDGDAPDTQNQEAPAAAMTVVSSLLMATVVMLVDML